MENDNKLIFAIIGGLLVVSIATFFLFPFSSENTVILQVPSGVGNSCVVDLVLPQDLTDLCDVTIINATSGQLLGYNGTQWINVNSVIFNDTTTCDNLGSGIIICALANDGNLSLRTLVSSTGISITNSSTEITIENTLPESTSASNVGNGANVFKNQTSAILYFKTILGGTGITVTNSTNTITLTNSLPESTVCSNTGSSLDATICNGSNVALKGMKESTGIDIVNNTNDITFKTKFANGTGISITGSTIQTFTNTGVTSLTSDDTNTLTFSSPSGAVTATPTIKKLCKAVATGGETSLTCTLSSNQEILMIMVDVTQTGDTNTVLRMQFNADGGNNYATRSSTNGGADATTGSISGIVVLPSGTTGSQYVHNNYRCIDIASGQEKHCYGERTTASNGAGNVPSRVETASKWANTANSITSVVITRTAGTGTMEAGNNIIVWGLT